jgi:hypothetical protein
MPRHTTDFNIIIFTLRFVSSGHNDQHKATRQDDAKAGALCIKMASTNGFNAHDALPVE